MDSHSLDILEYEKVKSMLAGYAACSLGRAAIERLQPMGRADAIRTAVQETTELRELLGRKGRLPVGGMTDVRPAVAATAEAHAPLEPQALLDIKNTLLAARSFKRLFEEEAELCPALAALGHGLDDFRDLCELVATVVAKDATVADDASPRLADVRRQMAALAERLRQKAYALAQSAAVRPLLQSEAVGIRRDRYVLAVKAACKHQLDGIIHDRSQTGATVYIEPRQLVVLANELDDLRFEERREVERLLWELTLAIREQRGAVLATLDTLARIDGAYAKARFSIDFDMSAPVISDAGRLDVRRARHPILVRVLERAEGDGEGRRVVPIDYRLGEDFDLLVITGPNTGGKTVSLKTIGLLALMAQSGLHVPAEPGSTFPVYADVLADIGDEQSIEQSLSTFSSHMTHIVHILAGAAAHTLVLLDELGAGTDPVEGAALGTAVLDFLRSKRAKTVVTTHIGDLKAYAYRRPGTANAACEFDQRSLQPTYRLLIGQPGNSNALSIAHRLGLPEGIIREANGILERRKGRDADIIADLQRSRQAIEDDREAAHRLRKEAQALRQQANAELRAAKAKAHASRREAEQEIHRQLRAVRDRVLGALRKLRNAPAPFADRAREAEAELEAAVQHTPLATKRQEFARGLKRDDYVYVVPFGETCRVRSVNKSKQRLQVVLGHNVVEVSFDDVSWLEAPADIP
ncbi:MAG: endonuclease MutS2 [Candidatus Brocadiia bacterium]